MEPQEEQENPGGLSSPAKAGGFWWFIQPCAHSCTHLLQKEKSKDFRNHVTKYLETLLNSQQQVSSHSPCHGFTSKLSSASLHPAQA